MFIKFDKVVLHNFLSFGHAEVSLKNNGYTLVSGCNLNGNDSALSNGAGKSSIFEAISWALTGDTIRGSRSIVNIHSEGGAYVGLIFSVDGAKYEIIRSKDHTDYGTNLKIFINGVDKSGKGIRDSERLLSEYLPDLTSQLIGSVIILGQGLPQRFSNNTPSGRKEVLENLSKSDFMIDDLKTRISKRADELNSLIKENENKMVSTDCALSIRESALDDYKYELSKMKNAEDLKEEISKYTDIIEDISQKLDGVQGTIKILEEKLNDEREKFLLLKSKEAEEIKSISCEKNDSLTSLNASKAFIEAKISSLKAEIDRISQIKDVCPTCGQRIPHVFKPDTSDLYTSVDSFSKELEKISDEIRKVNENYNNKASECSKKYESDRESIVITGKEGKKILDERKLEEQKYVSMLNSSKESLIRCEAEYNALESRRTELQKNIKDTESKIRELSDLYKTLEEKESDLVKHEDIINKFATAIKRDFRGYLLKNVIEYTDKKVKEYSLDVFGKPNVSVSLNKNSVDIVYDSRFYENLSGGEKQKVDIIIQLAIRDMLCKFLGFSSNILAVDECFDNLDEIGCQKVINLISKTLKDVDSIYIITHHTDIDIPYDKEIVVIKNDEGVSSVQ